MASNRYGRLGVDLIKTLLDADARCSTGERRMALDALRTWFDSKPEDMCADELRHDRARLHERIQGAGPGEYVEVSSEEMDRLRRTVPVPSTVEFELGVLSRCSDQLCLVHDKVMRGRIMRYLQDRFG